METTIMGYTGAANHYKDPFLHSHLTEGKIKTRVQYKGALCRPLIVLDS